MKTKKVKSRALTISLSPHSKGSPATKQTCRIWKTLRQDEIRVESVFVAETRRAENKPAIARKYKIPSL